MEQMKQHAGELVAVCLSEGKGGRKDALEGAANLVAGHGLEGDAHAGTWHRQLSLLDEQRIDEMRQSSGLDLPVGAFGENLVTSGIDLDTLEVGRRLQLGERAVIQITQRGKECHTRCKIFHQAGDCIMPRAGLFARVRRSGAVQQGSALVTLPELDRHRCAVITLSDRGAAGTADDTSGPAAWGLLEQGLPSASLTHHVVLPDEQQQIQQELIRLCDDQVCDLVLTSGGTGLSPRDVTPEATLAVIDREIPGMAEAMRAGGLQHTPRAMLSRGICGMRGQTLIINLSGSPRAVREQLELLLPVLPHALETASGVPLSCARPEEPAHQH